MVSIIVRMGKGVKNPVKTMPWFSRPVANSKDNWYILRVTLTKGE